MPETLTDTMIAKKKTKFLNSFVHYSMNLCVSCDVYLPCVIDPCVPLYLSILIAYLKLVFRLSQGKLFDNFFFVVAKYAFQLPLLLLFILTHFHKTKVPGTQNFT